MSSLAVLKMNRTEQFECLQQEVEPFVKRPNLGRKAAAFCMAYFEQFASISLVGCPTQRNVKLRHTLVLPQIGSYICAMDNAAAQHEIDKSVSPLLSPKVIAYSLVGFGLFTGFSAALWVQYGSSVFLTFANTLWTACF